MSSFSCLDASVAVKPVFDRFQTVVITSGVSVFVIYFSSFKNDYKPFLHFFIMHLSHNFSCLLSFFDILFPFGIN